MDRRDPEGRDDVEEEGGGCRDDGDGGEEEEDEEGRGGGEGADRRRLMSELLSPCLINELMNKRGEAGRRVKVDCD